MKYILKCSIITFEAVGYLQALLWQIERLGAILAKILSLWVWFKIVIEKLVISKRNRHNVKKGKNVSTYIGNCC